MCVICDLLKNAAGSGDAIKKEPGMKEQRKMLVKRNEGKTTDEVRELLVLNGFSLDRAVTILVSPDAYIYIQDIDVPVKKSTDAIVAGSTSLPPTTPAMERPNVAAALKKAFTEIAGLESIRESSQWALVDSAIELLRVKILKSGMESLTPVEFLLTKSFVAWLNQDSESKKS